MKDLAKEAGVSVATVSLVLNKKASHLSQATIDRVERLAKELGFVSNLHAKSLKTKQSQTIGLILPDITNAFFTQMAKRIEYHLTQAGYLLLLNHTDGVAIQEIMAIKRFKQLHVEKIVLVASHVSTYHFVEEHRLNHFVIFLDRIITKPAFCWVGSDDYQGGALVARALIAHHHYHVLCVTGPSHFTNVQERLAGFREVYQQNNHPYDVVCLEGDFTVDAGDRLAKTIFKHPYKAIFFMNDLMAIGFYHACMEAAISIQEQYAIIGYDDIEFVRYLSPPLTTVRQPIDAMARRVMHLILDEGEMHEKLPVTLISRKSLYAKREEE